MKVSVSGFLAMALICNISMAQARTMGHYAPGVVSIRDLAVPPVPGFSMRSTTLITRQIATLMATVTSAWTLSLKAAKSSLRPK
jgi:hypothetical protein